MKKIVQTHRELLGIRENFIFSLSYFSSSQQTCMHQFRKIIQRQFVPCLSFQLAASLVATEKCLMQTSLTKETFSKTFKNDLALPTVFYHFHKAFE